MVQQRVYDFGALLTQGRTKALASGLFTPGIYEGFEPTIVSPTLIEFSPGAILLPNGIFVRETGVTQVTVPTPGAAQDLTIVANHDDIQAVGGSPVYYTLETGLRARSGDPNPSSLALLWIRHPGSVPLADDMLSRPPLFRAGSEVGPPTNSIFVSAPFSQVADPVAGSNITATSKSRTVQVGTSAASLAPAAAGSITVTGLIGMTAASVDRYLRLSSASIAGNDGLFRITAFNSATSVDISDNGSAPGGGTANWREEELNNLGLQVVNSALVGLQTYQFRIPFPSGFPTRRIAVYASIPNLGSLSLSTHPYESFLEDATVLSMTPSSVAGPVEGLNPGSTPAAEFTLDLYSQSNLPVSLGVTLIVPPQTSGIFLKGFTFLAD